MATRDIIVISVWFVISITRIQCLSPGYSYAKFMGPVSGVEKQVTYDDGQYHQHDYMAKPDYHFEYGVADPNSKVHQSRQETRHGDTVQDPDGKVRTVRYTADKKNGFHASIITDGHVVHHPQDPVKPIHDEGHYVPHIPPEQAGGGGGGGEEDEYVEGDEEEEGGEEEGGEEEGEYADSGDEAEEDEYY